MGMRSLQAKMLMCLQEKQRRQAVIPLHIGREDTLRTDRMPQAAGLTTLCRQAVRLPGNDAAVGRESGGTHARHQLAEEVQSASRGW